MFWDLNESGPKSAKLGAHANRLPVLLVGVLQAINYRHANMVQ